MELARFFKAGYQEARSAFLQAAAARNAAIESVTHPARGPDNGVLATDIAWIGPRDAENVLVIQSGTHGIEGFCGSGAQLHWLESSGPDRIPAGTGVMLVHAVNPYGFAWRRRVDDCNIDLNRNWIDFNQDVPANGAYGKLHDRLLPDCWGAAAREAIAGALAAFAAEHGEASLRHALTGGQYSHSDGIFFGGTQPSWSRMTMTSAFQSSLGGAARIVILDYHSGLGERGFVEQLSPASSGDPEFARARAAFGAGVVSVADGASSSAKVGGDGMTAAGRLLAHAQTTTLGMEYGTRPFSDVLGALLADNWLHAKGDPCGPEAAAIKADLMAAFAGDDDVWKAMVIAQSGLVIRQALTFLAQRD